MKIIVLIGHIHGPKLLEGEDYKK